MAEENGLSHGIVKWFNNAKGYGFILNGPGGEDVFVHYSAIVMGGFKTLTEGQQVDYRAQRGLKGWQATEVIPLQPATLI